MTYLYPRRLKLESWTPPEGRAPPHNTCLLLNFCAIPLSANGTSMAERASLRGKEDPLNLAGNFLEVICSKLDVPSAGVLTESGITLRNSHSLKAMYCQQCWTLRPDNTEAPGADSPPS
ncbi:hypothetical protein BIW11_04722 [Tropilaelaps mercedesae]|uniref:Uncharacterized protein n=1 Tax=Tropilaelaps mercedesae TaxID=418985 RepID=A0A1V9X2P9_9ACAR|nr:hypothetical protein BIW11_04722 [Tropilaelaps mercedesae]